MHRIYPEGESYDNRNSLLLKGVLGLKMSSISMSGWRYVGLKLWMLSLSCPKQPTMFLGWGCQEVKRRCGKEYPQILLVLLQNNTLRPFLSTRSFRLIFGEAIDEIFLICKWWSYKFIGLLVGRNYNIVNFSEYKLYI